MDELDDYIKQSRAAISPSLSKVKAAQERAKKLGYDVSDDVVADFFDATMLESGRSHYKKNGSVKESPRDPKDGQVAVGFSQIKPGTIKRWGNLDPYNEDDNITGGLLEFDSIDKSDPIARRIGYFAGGTSTALKQYRATGKIPQGGDFTGTSFQKYIEKSNGFKAVDDYIRTIKNGGQSQPSTPTQEAPDDIDAYIQASVQDIRQPRVQPTKELDTTIDAQIQSANDPNVKTRFGVLATKPEQATLFANQPNFKPFETKEGTLWLNTAKIYANKKLKLKNEKDLAQYIAKNPQALTTLIGIDPQNDVGNATQGTALIAKDPKTGIELATTVVSTPTGAMAQAQNYQDQFPDAVIEVTDTDTVTDERKQLASQVLDDPRQLGGEFAEPTAPHEAPHLDRVSVLAPQTKKAITPVRTQKVPQNAQKRPVKPATKGMPELTEQDYQEYFATNPDLIDTPANRNAASELYKEGKWNTEAQRKKLGESDEPVILNDGPEVQRVSAKDADNAIADVINVKGLSVEDATKKVRSELSAKYGKDFNALVLIDTQGKPITDPAQLDKPIALTYGKLKTYGVDTEPLVSQRVAETRIEDPEPDLNVKSDFSAEDAESLNSTFGTTIGSAIASTLNAGGNTANSLAGLLKIIQELNPAKLDSMAEAAKLKPYRAGEDVIKYLQGVGASTGALTAKTGDKYYEPATADDKGYLEGRPVEKETWMTTGGKAVGALADMPRVALMPGGLAAPMLSFATDSMLQAASRGEKVDWGEVRKAGGHGAVLGGIAQVAPFVGKAGNTVISTLLNKASSNVLKEGITLGTIGGGTYVASREMGASKDAAFREAVLFSAMHGFGVLKKMIGEPVRVKDTNGNEAVIKVSEDGKVETLDPKTEAKAQMVIPKEVETKIQAYLKKDAEIQAEAKTEAPIEPIKPIGDTPIAKGDIVYSKSGMKGTVESINGKELGVEWKNKPDEIAPTTTDNVFATNPKEIFNKKVDEVIADTSVSPKKAAEDILDHYERTNTENRVIENAPTGQTKKVGDDSVKSTAEPQVDEIRPQGARVTDSVQPTTGTKPSKIGVSIERKTVEKGLVDTFEGTAGYEPTTVKEQASKIAEILTDPTRMKRIIAGEEKVPEGLRQSYFIKGVEDNALAKGDVETLKALAKSKLTSDTSAFAQEMRMMKERSQDSVTARINELRSIRREATKTKGHDVQGIEKRIADLEAQLVEHTKTNAEMQTKAEIAKVTSKQNNTRPLLDRAEKYANKLRGDAEKARERLKKRGAVFTSGIDPVALKDLAQIGASHIADLGLDFAKFSDKMIAEFGDKVKPHLKDLFEKATEMATRFERRALNTIKTRLEKQIADLKEQIETQTRKVVTREPVPLDAEGMKLKEQRDALKKELDEVVPRVKKGISDEQYNTQRVKALAKQIASLDEQIKTGVKQNREVHARKVSPEVEKLAKQRDELRAQYDEVFGKPEMSDAKRLQAWKKQAENRIAILTGQKEPPVKGEPITTKLDAEGQKLQTQINLLKSKVDLTDTEIEKIAELTKAVADARPKLEGHQREPLGKPTPEEIAYATADVALSNYVHRLKVKAGRATLSEIKEADTKGKLKIAARGAMKLALEHPGFTKNILASLDASATALTGWRMGWAHPTIWAKNAAKAQADIVKTFGNQPVADALKIDIQSRPNQVNGKYKKMELDVSAREEDFPMENPFGRLAATIDKIPSKSGWTPSNVGKQTLKTVPNAFVASENAFVGFQHRNRADVADFLLPRFEKTPRTDTDYKNLGRLINGLTGRGYLGKDLEKASAVVNLLMFAPRFLKSELDAFGHILTGGATVGEMLKHAGGKESGNIGTNFVRVEAAKNLAKFVIGTASVLAVANALKPGSVEFDPRSSDFGKIKIGNTRFDVSGHMASLVTLAARLITNETKSGKTGEISKLNEKDKKGKQKWGGRTTLDVFEDYVEGKASPYGHFFLDWLKGEDFDGNPVDLKTYKSWDRAMTNMHKPLPIKNVEELLNDPNAAPLWAGIIADYFGVTTNTYGGSKHVQRLINEARERGDDKEVERLKPILKQEREIERKKDEQRKAEMGTPVVQPQAMPMQKK